MDILPDGPQAAHDERYSLTDAGEKELQANAEEENIVAAVVNEEAAANENGGYSPTLGKEIP